LGLPREDCRAVFLRVPFGPAGSGARHENQYRGQAMKLRLESREGEIDDLQEQVRLWRRLAERLQARLVEVRTKLGKGQLTAADLPSLVVLDQAAPLMREHLNVPRFESSDGLTPLARVFSRYRKGPNRESPREPGDRGSEAPAAKASTETPASLANADFSNAQTSTRPPKAVVLCEECRDGLHVACGWGRCDCSFAPCEHDRCECHCRTQRRSKLR
jgi:hypothetical protein